jgi:o-succinylbenzoate synthase
MNIFDIRWYPYSIPFRDTFSTAHGQLTVREGAIVEVIATNSLSARQSLSGFGEIAPMPEFRGESLATALAALPTCSTQLRGKSLTTALNILYAEQERTTLPAATLCGLEIALLDALGKAQDQSMSQLLTTQHTPPRTSVQVNAVVGAATTETATTNARAAVAAGFHCIKLKVGQGEQADIERIGAVRAAIGPDIQLRLDANEGWSFEQAVAILNTCAPYHIQYIEQPLKANDLAAMSALRRAVPIPIAADEALHDLESAQRILAQQVADLLIIKPQLAGGLRMAQQMVHLATEHHVQCVVTSTIETGIGIAAALHLVAATPTITLECGLATLPLLTDDLLVTDLPIQHGSITVPHTAGLGVEPDRAALKLRRNNAY